jgi:hypothetical protein
MSKRWDKIKEGWGRNDFPALLVENWQKLNETELPKAVVDSWIMPEWPARTLEPKYWVQLFNMALRDGTGYLTDEGEIKSTEELPEVVTLYRGCYSEFAEGMSWTSSLETAKWFASRMGGNGNVYTVTVPNNLVLGVFNDRNENEYVLACTELLEDDVQLLERIRE